MNILQSPISPELITPENASEQMFELCAEDIVIDLNSGTSANENSASFLSVNNVPSRKRKRNNADVIASILEDYSTINIDRKEALQAKSSYFKEKSVREAEEHELDMQQKRLNIRKTEIEIEKMMF